MLTRQVSKLKERMRDQFKYKSETAVQYNLKIWKESNRSYRLKMMLLISKCRIGSDMLACILFFEKRGDLNSLCQFLINCQGVFSIHK